MSFLLGYRRPDYVDKEKLHRDNNSLSSIRKSNASLKSGRSSASSGIPDALTFDKIMSGGTCPPCTIRDFMNYLLYIEHAAENLQFLLWYRDYVKRFSRADTSETQLSPEWTQAMEDEMAARIQKDAVDKMKREPKVASTLFKGTDFEKGAAEVVVENRDPFSTPPSTPSTRGAPSFLSSSHPVQDAFKAAGATQPFTIQPFRTEMTRVLVTYIAASAPRALNLSGRERRIAVHAIAHTTHPSALLSVARTVENTLRRQSHPNFIRWCIGNGNPARVHFARVLGAGAIALATVAAVVLALSQVGRGWRALCAVGWVGGIAALVASYKGMCVVLHGVHHRQVRPWELFEEAAPSPIANRSLDESELEDQSGKGKGTSFDSFGSANSYEDQPWVVRYERRSVVRKVFDREVWVREPALRQIQDAIFVQSVLAALLGAGVLTALFVAVPAGGFF
ncbi:hypothetical protein GGR54DRAFT_376716 [Hypoxylon sp. NC1633]|nr:hypothetical protein GGR54DRAFT_376716 [Hypoxylon sp. NC1633]